MNLERTVKWIDKTDGRDKFCKAIQYACRFLKHRLEMQGNKEASKKFQSLFGNMRDARKLFRLFKTINEVKKIQDLLKAELTTENVLSILVRVFFGIYWFFDNLNILSKIKILSHDPKRMGKLGATFWLLALVTNLVLLVKQLIANVEKVNKVKAKKYGSMSDSEARDRKKELGTLLVKRQALLLNVVKVVGDIIPAGQGSEFFSQALGFKANDSWCGMGGFISAVVTSYQLYDY